MTHPKGALMTLLLLASLLAAGAKAENGGEFSKLPAASAYALGGSDAGSSPSPQDLSRLKLMAASLVLPGWGQWMAGHHDRARIFFAAEAGIAVSYVTFRVQGSIRRNRYIDYAEQFADIEDASDRPDAYYRNLARYGTSDDYIDDIARDARAIHGADLEARQAFIEAHRPSAEELWTWQSRAHREEFNEQRKSSRNSFRRADQMLGLALLNRLLSAVEVVRSMRGGRSNQALYVEPGPHGTQRVGLSWKLN